MISAELLDQTLEKIKKTSAAYIYFFNNINSPAWLQPLKEKGYFKTPPPAIREDGYIQWPSWPESGYLVRVADKAEDEVLEIIKSLPKDLDNERVMDDVVNALLKINISKAVRLTETVKSYVNGSQFLLLHHEASEFICKLADAGHVRAALSLAQNMLEVLPDPNKETKLKKENYISIEPTTKYRDHDYQTIVEKITPSLAKAAPLAAIDMYADLLYKSIIYEFTTIREDGKEVVIDEKKDDFSFISRPNIAEEDEYGHGPENVLITALRDSAVELMCDSGINGSEKLAKLKSLVTDKKYTVFKRIVEFALRNYKNDDTYKHFYAALIKDAKLKSILDGEKNGVGKMTTGFVTDKPTEVLKDLSDTELLENLRTYKNEKGWSFERESISKELGELVKLNPKRFISLIEEIAATKNEYFDETIRAFVEAVDELNESDINKMMATLINIYSAGNTVKDDEQRDYYSWSKASSIRLIEKLTSKKEDKTERMTTQNLASATKLILLLSRDKSPNGEDDLNFDPIDLSINSNRGKALHAIAYLLAWMNRNKVERALYKSIFDELDWHLKSANDPIPAIRAVYGWRFEILYGADEKWATENLDIIFSNDALGNAAFDARMMFNRVHEDELKILNEVFVKQLPRLTKPPDDESKTRHDGLKSFVQHLALHYMYSTLDLSDGSLMNALLETADKKYIKELANFIGFRLYKTKNDKLDEQQIKKLVDLWEAIVKLANDDSEKSIALAEFGTWFASGIFDPMWSLSQLSYAASKGDIDLDFAALEYMQTLAKEHPAESVKALSAMVDGSRDRWAISSWSKNSTVIIQTAYNSSDSAVKQSAKGLANKLVAKGHNEYRSIVKDS